MKSIVVGVDGSQCSLYALDFAAEEAALRGAPLLIVCAWDIPEIGYGVSADYPKEFFDAIREEAKAIVAKARARAAELKPTLPVRTKAVKGHAGSVIVREAKNAALVAVGNRGRGGVASLLLGSVSHYVVHLAPCPVIIVRVAAC